MRDKTLTVLNLATNQIGDLDVQQLANALRVNKVEISFYTYIHLHLIMQTLTSLILYLNNIGDVGAQHLADALRVSKVEGLFSLRSN